VFAIKVDTPADDVKAVEKPKDVFRGVDRKRQVRIVLAVRRAEVLPDAADAALAVRYARTIIEKKGGWRRVVRALGAVGAAGYLILELLLSLRGGDYEVPTWTSIVLSFYLFTHVYGWFASRRFQANARRAERLNLQFVESAGLKVDEATAPTADLRATAEA
jgi:hypothetical protein